MTSLKLSLNLSPEASESSQFTADWGNLNTIYDLTPNVFWASTSGAQLNVANATAITFSGLTKTITISLSISGTGGVSSMRYNKNGANSTYSTPFTVVNGDILKVGVVGPSANPISGSGNITVTNTTDSYVIDTIPYTVNIE